MVDRRSGTDHGSRSSSHATVSRKGIASDNHHPTGDARIAQWVCKQAGGFYIRNPQNLPPTSNVIPATNGIVQEFADMLATIATASADNVISKEEAKTIRRRRRRRRGPGRPPGSKKKAA